MTRGFWAALMVAALALGGTSAYLIQSKLNQPKPQPAPLHKIAAPKPAPSVAVSSGSVTASSEPARGLAAAPSKATSARPATAEPKKSAAAPSKPVEKPAARDNRPRRNILFRLARPTAKRVDIVGDFNGWTPHPLRKVGKIWQTSVALPAGHYEYAFLVDGKRMRDPNNRQANRTGKSSVLTVKPLPTKR